MKKRITRNLGFAMIALITSLFMLNSCNDDDNVVVAEEIADLIPKINATKGFALQGESISFEFAYDTIPNNISSYAWTFEGGSPESSTDAKPSVTYSSLGTFEASLTITRASDSKEFSGVYDVSVLEKATTAFTADVTTTEQGSQIVFTSSSSSDDNLAWTFEGGTPETSTDPTVTVTYITPGTFDVSLASALNGSLATVTETDFIEVTALATPTFTATATTINQRESVTYTNTTAIPDASIKWTFTGGDVASSTDNEVTVTYAEPGVFGVVLEVTKNAAVLTTDEPEYLTVIDVVEPAFFENAQTSGDGTTITLNYDQPLDVATGETITVSVNGANVSVASVANDPNDDTQIIATLATPMTIEDAAVTVTYTPSITTPAGGALDVLTDQAVTNKYVDVTINRFANGGFEGVGLNEYAPSGGFQNSGDWGKINVSFEDNVGVSGSRALVFTTTDGEAGAKRAVFGDKDKSNNNVNVQYVRPLKNDTEFTVTAMIKFTGVKPENFELGIVKFPFNGGTLIWASMDMDVDGLIHGADFVEVKGTVRTRGNVAPQGYAIPRITVGGGNSQVIVDDVKVFASQP